MEGVCPNGNCAPQKSERSYLFINFYFVRVTRMVRLGTLVKYIQWKKKLTEYCCAIGKYVCVCVRAPEFRGEDMMAVLLIYAA